MAGQGSRILGHPILDFPERKQVSFTFDGRTMVGYEGEPVLTALYSSGITTFSKSPRFHRPRGLYCAIGKCSSCDMRVDGVPNVRTCITPLKEGMLVETQNGYGEAPTTISHKVERTHPFSIEVDVAVIGGGPAGLAAAAEAAREGVSVRVFDESITPGGQLIKQTHRFFGSYDEDASVRGVVIADELFKEVEGSGAMVHQNATVFGYYDPGFLAVEQDRQLIKVFPKRVVVATGASENVIAFEDNDLPGVYGAGAIQTLVNVHGVRAGSRVLMVGSGNVGLIVAYQMIQAGLDVVGIVEAAPRIGGYLVHASKIRRFGVPIHVGTTITKALGEDRVTGAILQDLDGSWEPVSGTERTIDCDVICLAVGLRPTVELLFQAGCDMRSVGELCGHVPFRDDNMQTSTPGWYVAGDASGIEEATVAILEGRLAGLHAAASIAGGDVQTRICDYRARLDDLRSGPMGFRIKQGIDKVVRECVLPEPKEVDDDRE